MKKWLLLLLVFGYCFANTTLTRYPNPFQSLSQTLPLQQIIIPIHYQSVKSLAKLLQDKKLHWLSAQGHVVANLPSRQLWISDHAANCRRIQKLISQLDKMPQQIAIRAKIINIDHSVLDRLGLQFHTGKADTHADSQNGSFTLPIAKLNTDSQLLLHLDALTQKGQAKLIATPKLSVINGKTASLQAGEEIPYQQYGATGNTNIAFKKVVIKLEVTPTIDKKNRILLQVDVNQDKLSGLVVQGVPAIHTQQLHTQAILHNQQTLVLGGMLQDNEDIQKQGIPVIDRIPLLGKLFHHRVQRHSQRELLVFITPRIMRNHQ